MESPSPTAIGCLEQADASQCRLFISTTTGWVGIQTTGHDACVHPAGFVHAIPPDGPVSFWSCLAAFDPTPSGTLTVLGCQGQSLTSLVVRHFSGLLTLDCSDNRLTELDLAGLDSLENLYCQGNPLPYLDPSPCASLRRLRTSSPLLGMPADPSTPPSRLRAVADGLYSFLLRPSLRAVPKSLPPCLCAATYVSPRTRRLSSSETAIRATAYALKVPTPESLALAAPAMAALISGPCWLVPIPAHDGRIEPNLMLARAIASLVPGARVRAALARSRAVPSLTSRHRRGLGGLSAKAHHFVSTGGPLSPIPLYFVDNVVTTGSTLRAARARIGWGLGLVYADASPPFLSRLRESARNVSTPCGCLSGTLPGQ